MGGGTVTEPFISTIEWLDPLVELPMPGEIVFVADRMGCISFCSFDDEKGVWIEQWETNQGAFSYEWQASHVHAWALIPEAPPEGFTMRP